MKPTAIPGEIPASQSAQKPAAPFLKALALAAIAILTLAFSTPAAHASCGRLVGELGSDIKLPAIAAANPQLIFPIQDSIVGLWEVVYTTSSGGPFGVSFKQWHSDGTEFENIDHSPIVGNTCMGVWKAVSFRTVHLHHLGWLFGTDGSPQGSFIIDEVDNVSNNGLNYSGTFTFKTYDTNGNYTGTEITGTTAATRITVD
jgi:hypothetical protein